MLVTKQNSHDTVQVRQALTSKKHAQLLFKLLSMDSNIIHYTLSQKINIDS